MNVRTIDPPRSLDRALESCIAVVEIVAFWTTVALPLTYLPLFVAVRYGSVSKVALGGLLAANALALVVGHRHRAPTDANRPDRGRGTEGDDR